MSASEILELLEKLRYDCTAMQSKISELKRMAATLPAAEQPTLFSCPLCSLNLKSQARVEEHLANVHARGLDEVVPPPSLAVSVPPAPPMLDVVLPKPEVDQALDIDSDQSA